jgi:diaminopimelate epimerase
VSNGFVFWKMSGAGNDFIVIDARMKLPAPVDELAQRLCPRGLAVGADGVLAVGSRAGGVEVTYRNADGSPAGFCGNGARCAARFAVERGLSGASLSLWFGEREVPARVDGREVRLQVPIPRLLGSSRLELARSAALEAKEVDAGVRHLVIGPSPDGSLPELTELRAALERQDPEMSRRVNVTTVARKAEGALLVRTDELGAGETLACGSGALAAALVAGGEKATVLPPAGIPLLVTLDVAGGWATLSGEAVLVYRGEIDDLSRWPR